MRLGVSRPHGSSEPGFAQSLGLAWPLIPHCSFTLVISRDEVCLCSPGWSRAYFIIEAGNISGLSLPVLVSP